MNPKCSKSFGPYFVNHLPAVASQVLLDGCSDKTLPMVSTFASGTRLLPAALLTESTTLLTSSKNLEYFDLDIEANFADS